MKPVLFLTLLFPLLLIPRLFTLSFADFDKDIISGKQCRDKLVCVHPEIVDFGSRQGHRIFSTAGVVRLRRGSKKSENAVLGRKMLFLDGH